jgi:hypothetical protein
VRYWLVCTKMVFHYSMGVILYAYDYFCLYLESFSVYINVRWQALRRCVIELVEQFSENSPYWIIN